MLIVAISYDANFSCSFSATREQVDPENIKSINVCLYNEMGVLKEKINEIIIYENENMIKYHNENNLGIHYYFTQVRT